MKSKLRSGSQKIMKIEEIHRRYPAEWVLIEDPVSDKQLRPLRGRVVLHSKDRLEFDQKMAGMRLRRSATVFTGRFPENMEFVL
jgi:hypothetical protein